MYLTWGSFNCGEMFADSSGKFQVNVRFQDNLSNGRQEGQAPGRGVGTPLSELYRYVRPQKGMVFQSFWS